MSHSFHTVHTMCTSLLSIFILRLFIDPVQVLDNNSNSLYPHKTERQKDHFSQRTADKVAVVKPLNWQNELGYVNSSRPDERAIHFLQSVENIIQQVTYSI